MRKILLALMIGLFLVSSIASAQPSSVRTNGLVFERPESAVSLGFQERERIQERIQTQMTTLGLEKALVVADDEALPVLQANLERLQEKHGFILEKLDNIVIEQKTTNGPLGEVSSTHIKGVGEAKLLGLFKIRKTYEYRVNNVGDMIRNNKWYDFLMPDA